jgi:hypothetical protein
MIFGEAVQFTPERRLADVEAAKGFQGQAVAVDDVAVGVSHQAIERRHVHAGEVGIDAHEGGKAVLADRPRGGGDMDARILGPLRRFIYGALGSLAGRSGGAVDDRAQGVRHRAEAVAAGRKAAAVDVSAGSMIT